MSPDRRVGNTKHNTTYRILNSVINAEAFSKFFTPNIELTSVNGVENPETVNVDSEHLQNLSYLFTDEFILVYLTQNRRLVTIDRPTRSLGGSA